ncbi:MAG: biotin--[acetyl-CoA-carboxylase] ligase [Chloroflexota bacterium]
MKNPEKRISRLLKTQFLGRKLVYYPSLPSTMDTARELAHSGAAEGTTIIAGTQTAGRGRLGRNWLSPEGALAMSVILRPELNQLPQLIMVASLAVVKTIKESTALDARIKWPNDVLIRGKKVCGILTESEIKGHQASFAIVGIGLNINMNPVAHPDIAAIATSLSGELSRPVSYEETTAGLLNNLETYYLRVRSGQPVALEWRRNMETIGKAVRIRNGNEVVEGIAEDVSADGALLLRLGDGGLVTIFAGDVTVIKD